ncbi:MAG TPA: Gfo/Idh/MocA family oxidoreductase [Opitutus sp.]|nr:Gfo/Idh/MocA family oxidoreductase [Opitutus sp.]
MNRRAFLSHTTALAAVSLLPRRSSGAESPSADPRDYLPREKPAPVVKPGEFVFAAAYFEHPHLIGQCTGLISAGATLKWIYEPDEKKRVTLLERFPAARAARSFDEILADPEVRLVTAAAVTSQRGPLGCRVMEAGKDYFTDKAPFTTLEQLEQARSVTARTSRKYMVYYSERLHNESAMFATELVRQGVIGRVLQVIGLGPHRLNASSRPAWFFEREQSGGILCDIGSHQFEQFLTFSGAPDATVLHAAIANYAHPQYPSFEDFGEASLVGANGASNYIRVDWFTPPGLGTWGDGRTFLLGTKGTLELRKYIEVGREKSGDHVYLVDARGEHRFHVGGQVGFRFFGEFILDCLNRTEHAMTQAHAFQAAEICLRAQAAARRLA